MNEFLRTINEKESKKLLAVLKYSKVFSFVVYGPNGEFYVLRGQVAKGSSKPVFDSDENIGKIIAQIDRTKVSYVDYSFSDKDRHNNLSIKSYFIKYLDKVLGIKKLL